MTKSKTGRPRGYFCRIILTISTLCLLGPLYTGGAAAGDADIENTDRDKIKLLKIKEPNLSFEGFERIVAAASGGLASAAPATDYNFADYMFEIDGLLVGVYWEEAANERPSAAILENVVALLKKTCDGWPSSGELGTAAFGLFTLHQGFVACENFKRKSYSAVSVLNFGAAAQIYVTSGDDADRHVLEQLNSNISDVEDKLFQAIRE